MNKSPLPTFKDLLDKPITAKRIERAQREIPSAPASEKQVLPSVSLGGKIAKFQRRVLRYWELTSNQNRRGSFFILKFHSLSMRSRA